MRICTFKLFALYRLLTIFTFLQYFKWVLRETGIRIPRFSIYLSRTQGLSSIHSMFNYNVFRVLFFLQLEQLYIEVLYTIANTVGTNAEKYTHYKEDLFRYAQEAFGVSADQHIRFLKLASEEKVRHFLMFNNFSKIIVVRQVSPV